MGTANSRPHCHRQYRSNMAHRRCLVRPLGQPPFKGRSSLQWSPEPSRGSAARRRAASYPSTSLGGEL